MKPIPFDGMTQTLGAPPGMENCEPLPVMSLDGGGFRSVWKLDPEERERVMQNGLVILDVYGEAHPPVWLGSVDGRHRMNAADDPLLVRQARAARDALVFGANATLEQKEKALAVAGKLLHDALLRWEADAGVVVEGGAE